MSDLPPPASLEALCERTERENILTFKWLARGSHIHTSVYINGTLSGNLVFSLEEFLILTTSLDTTKPDLRIRFTPSTV